MIEYHLRDPGLPRHESEADSYGPEAHAGCAVPAHVIFLTRPKPVKGRQAHPRMSPSPEVTRLLQRLSDGDTRAVDRLMPVVYEEMRVLARSELRRERSDHTLNATALVNEAYMRLAQLDRIDWKGRAHFFGAAAKSMRRILIDYARRRSAEKRGDGAEHVSLDSVVVAARERPTDLLVLDEALTRLEELDARQARVVECRFFGGMEIRETAEALGISQATVKRDWVMAKAWLNRELDA